MRGLTEAEIERHNQLFQKGAALVQAEMLMDDAVRAYRPNWFARRRLRQAIESLSGALRLSPDNWQARLFVAKAYQRLGERQIALRWLREAHEIAPDQAVVLKEAVNETIALGELNEACELSHRALSLAPGDAVLHYNLGLALLLRGETQAALDQLTAAAQLDGHPATRRLQRLAEAVARGHRPCPRTLEDLETAV